MDYKEWLRQWIQSQRQLLDTYEQEHGTIGDNHPLHERKEWIAEVEAWLAYHADAD